MKIVAFDLECTSLSSMIGRILCCSFKEILPSRRGRVYTIRGDDRHLRCRDIANDSKLCGAIRNELAKFDVWVAHNGKLFDRKFLNGRLIKWGLTPLNPTFFVDTMWIIRQHMRASSKLQNIQEFLGLSESKTPITWDSWMRAGAFDRSAMDDVVRHCEQDVKVLELAYWRLLPLMRTLQRT